MQMAEWTVVPHSVVCTAVPSSALISFWLMAIALSSEIDPEVLLLRPQIEMWRSWGEIGNCANGDMCAKRGSEGVLHKYHDFSAYHSLRFCDVEQH